MQGPSALLTLLLAGPPLAAPPVDVDRVLALITDGDPAQTPDTPPGPISDLVEAAELAAGALERAEPRHLSELLGYLDTARSLAYQRTGDLSHVRARLAAVETLLVRSDLPPNVQRRALKIRDTDRDALAEAEAKPEATTQVDAPEPPPPLMPVRVVSSEAPEADTAARPRHPAAIASGVLFGVAGAMVAGLVGVQAHDAKIVRDLKALWSDIDAAGGKTPEQDTQARELQHERQINAAATASIGVLAGVTLLTGLGLGLWARKQRRGPRVTATGGPHGGGLVIHGRF